MKNQNLGNICKKCKAIEDTECTYNNRLDEDGYCEECRLHLGVEAGEIVRYLNADGDYLYAKVMENMAGRFLLRPIDYEGDQIYPQNVPEDDFYCMGAGLEIRADDDWLTLE